MKKLLTLVLVEKEGELLLGMKKRGFGEGRWNGFGGKLEKGESIEEAAKRELYEEVGLEARLLDEVGRLTFSFVTDESLQLEVHVFKTTAVMGDVIETDEMKPRWFSFEDIPYTDMWPDDVLWLPKVLEGNKVVGNFELDAPASLTHAATILSHHIHEVAGFEDGVY